VQGDGGPAELRKLEDVGQQILGKDDATGADERYLDNLPSFDVGPTMQVRRPRYFMPVLAMPWMK
jgi:hypothetical protein